MRGDEQAADAATTGDAPGRRQPEAGAAVAWPRWIEEIRRSLPIRSQFVLSGNIRDVFLTPARSEVALNGLIDCLWAFLESLGYEFLLVYDRVDGMRVHPADASVQDRARSFLDLKLVNGTMAVTNLDTLAQVARRVAHLVHARAALVIDFASRISPSPQAPDSLDVKFYTALEKLSLTAAPLAMQRAQADPGGEVTLFNPVFWLLNRAHDMPPWFSLDSERVASVVIPRPDFETRLEAAQVMAPLFRGFEDTAQPARHAIAMRFADGTHGMSLQSMADITRLARWQGFALAEIDDAVRCFKVGATDNPWRKDYLRTKIRGARGVIEERVKGQHQAVVKTIDILMRSVMGLTGAQARSSGGRPRGVLFFAGPTGVGKTELAKTLTQLLFGDERAYIRFDMSEFAEEHAATRLLGAPPGYIGYAAGGELTNAVKQRPFSVILFDEIEKCHPRVLDKFLQILEDGRLTDGQGATAYFTEAVIIFTSNLGILVEDENGHRIQNVKPGDAYEVIEARVRRAIEDHFKYSLVRPELLNRIGDNIVVFNYIRPDVARDILDGMLRNIAKKVSDEHRTVLEIAPGARAKILDWCTRDLSNGGRGIGNALESVLINPLARALFESDIEGRARVEVTDIVEQDRIYMVSLA
jgi:ATP-dependent Clp protease ATP-binding subunit ClpB